MAKKKPEPALTQTEILVFASEYLLEEYHKWAGKEESMAQHYRNKLEALNTLYTIETGEDLSIDWGD